MFIMFLLFYSSSHHHQLESTICTPNIQHWTVLLKPIVDNTTAVLTINFGEGQLLWNLTGFAVTLLSNKPWKWKKLKKLWCYYFVPVTLIFRVFNACFRIQFTEDVNFHKIFSGVKRAWQTLAIQTHLRLVDVIADVFITIFAKHINSWRNRIPSSLNTQT